MNPLLKEIQYDRLIKQMTDEQLKKKSKLNRIEKMQCGCNNYQQQQPGSWMSCSPSRMQQGMNMQPLDSVLPQTFLPTQVGQPVPPPSFEATASQVGPFNPYCQPIYPPGCPTPGCPGSYPGYQPPSNVPPTMEWQQEFRMQCPPNFNNNQPGRYR